MTYQHQRNYKEAVECRATAALHAHAAPPVPHTAQATNARLMARLSSSEAQAQSLEVQQGESEADGARRLRAMAGQVAVLERRVEELTDELLRARGAGRAGDRAAAGEGRSGAGSDAERGGGAAAVAKSQQGRGKGAAAGGSVEPGEGEGVSGAGSGLRLRLQSLEALNMQLEGDLQEVRARAEAEARRAEEAAEQLQTLRQELRRLQQEPPDRGDVPAPDPGRVAAAGARGRGGGGGGSVGGMQELVRIEREAAMERCVEALPLLHAAFCKATETSRSHRSPSNPLLTCDHLTSFGPQLHSRTYAELSHINPLVQG